MKRTRQPIRPVDPELAFAADVFNLHGQSTGDGWRVCAEQQQRGADRQEAETKQPALIMDMPKNGTLGAERAPEPIAPDAVADAPTTQARSRA